MNSEGHLAQVVASRARDHRWISGVTLVSDFLKPVWKPPIRTIIRGTLGPF